MYPLRYIFLSLYSFNKWYKKAMSHQKPEGVQITLTQKCPYNIGKLRSFLQNAEM